MFGHLIRPGRQSERAGASILVSRVLRNPTTTGKAKGRDARRFDVDPVRNAVESFQNFPSDQITCDRMPFLPRTNNFRPLLYTRDEGTINNWSLSVLVPSLYRHRYCDCGW